MRDEPEIRGKIAEFEALISEYRSQAQRGTYEGNAGNAGNAYIEAMYASAALHALQWTVGDLAEPLLLRNKGPLR